MTVVVRSFAKVNFGLYIGAPRADGFHSLRTVYQIIALHDVIRVTVSPGSGIEILCDDPRVPLDSSNTCSRIASLVVDELEARVRVTVEIEKKLPVQGGMGAASSNAVATMLALEKALRSQRKARKTLDTPARLRIAAAVGSDLPLFVIGGTVLGVGRGEEVYPLADLPKIPMVVVTPDIGVSTPQAFADWDAMGKSVRTAGLTQSPSFDRLSEVSRALSTWLTGLPDNTGASAKVGSRAGSLLSDLVRTGIENDFEKVVFPQSPELRDIKRALERAGSRYSSLSGSGSTLYGLFRSRAEAELTAKRLRKQGLRAVVTQTLTRPEYLSKSFVARH
jgi:4-diphosphocytidyl-2-C-methyl-D-erythritol kinase